MRQLRACKRERLSKKGAWTGKDRFWGSTVGVGLRKRAGQEVCELEAQITTGHGLVESDSGGVRGEFCNFV